MNQKYRFLIRSINIVDFLHLIFNCKMLHNFKLILYDLIHNKPIYKENPIKKQQQYCKCNLIFKQNKMITRFIPVIWLH